LRQESIFCRKLKARCTRAPFRKIARDINEEARDYARSLTGTPEFERSSNERKKVEMRFAHLKVQHRFDRMRLRGLTGARDEFHLAAIVQNLKTLANRPLATIAKHGSRLLCLIVSGVERQL
jgi:Transposase DDE domain